MNSWEPETAVESSLVDSVCLDLLGALGLGRDPVDQLVERALGVEHHRPQLAADLEPEPLRRSARPAGLVPQLLQPERVGQPPGRIDRDHGDLGPRAAIPSAIAAEVVVLPTPPEPAQTHTRLPSSSSATLTSGV